MALDLLPLAQNRRELAQGIDFGSQKSSPRSHRERVDRSADFVNYACRQKAQHQGRRHVLQVYELTISLREERLERRIFCHRRVIAVIDYRPWNHPAFVTPQLGTKTEVYVFADHKEIII